MKFRDYLSFVGQISDLIFMVIAGLAALFGLFHEHPDWHSVALYVIAARKP